MNSFSPHLYKLQAQYTCPSIDNGTLESATKRYAYMFDKGIVPILSLKHLSILTNSPYSLLRETVSRKIDPYKTIYQRKNSGGRRCISSPENDLKLVQRWILDFALSNIKTHPLSFAYEKEKNIRECAEVHVGMRWMIKLDIRNFFDSIKEKQVYRVFRDLGYPSLISFEMSRICTRFFPSNSYTENELEEYRAKYPSIHTYISEGIGCLPQGSPTSGALANAVCFPLDRKINRMAIRNGFAYSRYSDDVFLSTNTAFSRIKAQQIISSVSQLVRQEGFSLQKKKTHVITPGARKIVLGLAISDQGVKPMREFRKAVESDIYGVSKFGLLQQVHYRHYHSIFGFVNHVDGCISFIRGIDQELGNRYQEKWENAISKYGL